MQAVLTALIALTKKTSSRATEQPWWDNACNKAVILYRQKRAHLQFLANLEMETQEAQNETSTAKGELRCATCHAKHTYWQRKINEALQSSEVFQIIK